MTQHAQANCRRKPPSIASESLAAPLNSATVESPPEGPYPESENTALPPVPSYRQNCTKQNQGWIVPTGIITAGIVYSFYSGFSQGETLQYAVSMGCTNVIQNVLVPLVFIPMARLTMSKFQDTQIGSWLGLQKRITTHKIAAVVLVCAAAAHTACVVWDWPKFIQAKPAGWTGVGMWSLLAVPQAGSYLIKNSPCLKSCSYVKKFKYPHGLSALVFAGFLSGHAKNWALLPWVAPVAGAVVVDRLVERYLYRHKTTITEAKIEGDLIALKIARPEGMKIRAGQYINLELNGGFHPFTIAWFNEKEFGLLIAPLGPATKNLYDWVKANQGRQASQGQGQDQANQNMLFQPVPATIEGPFASSYFPSRAEGLLMISSGGAASVAAAMLQGDTNGGIGLIHSARKPGSFFTLIDQLGEAKKQGVPFRSVHLFLTGSDEAFSGEVAGSGQKKGVESRQKESVDLRQKELQELRQKIRDSGMTLREICPENSNLPQSVDSKALGDQRSLAVAVVVDPPGQAAEDQFEPNHSKVQSDSRNPNDDIHVDTSSLNPPVSLEVVLHYGRFEPLKWNLPEGFRPHVITAGKIAQAAQVFCAQTLDATVESFE